MFKLECRVDLPFLVSRSVHFDLSECDAVTVAMPLLQGILDAAQQILSCDEVQKLFIPHDHLDVEPSEDLVAELASAKAHLEALVMTVVVEPFTDNEVGAFASSELFSSGRRELRINSNMLRSNLTSVPFRRCVSSHSL